MIDSTLLGIPAWQIVSAGALLVLAAFVFLRQRKTPKGARPKSVWRRTLGFAEQAMSTMRLTDTQRIDRLQRVVSLKPGEQADLKDLSFDQLPKLRIMYKGMEHQRGQEFAHIKVELGGATANCGDSVEEIGDNDFLVPRAGVDEQRSSIHYMYGKTDAVSFLQVKVKKFDITEGSAAIDVLHVRGRRAA